jgi:hypothetical protein
VKPKLKELLKGGSERRHVHSHEVLMQTTRTTKGIAACMLAVQRNHAFFPCIGERERRERSVRKVYTLMLRVLRAENPKYDSTEWQELQKQYGNLERTNRDLLREDEEEEAKAVAKMVIEQAVSLAARICAGQIT